MTTNPTRLALPLAALMLLAGCGGDDADSADTATAPAEAATEAPVAPAEPAADTVAPTLGAAAIDPLARGIRRENEMLASVAERMGEADTDAAKLLLMTEVQPATLEAEGAKAAGLETAEYRQLKDQLFTVVGQAEMRTMLEQQFAAADTTGMDEATAEQARKNLEEMKAQLSDPFAGVDAGTADAIRARQAELTELRSTHIGLLFKAAGG